LPLPVVVDNMRPRDRANPEDRLAPQPETLPKPQISRLVRGVRPEKRRSNATITADAINNNLQLIDCQSNQLTEAILGITNTSIIGFMTILTVSTCRLTILATENKIPRS